MNSAPHLARLCRYPVKGLGGETLTTARLAADGLEFDRALGIANGRRPIEPFGTWTSYEAFHALAARPDLGGFSARVLAGPAVELRHPDGATIAVPLTEDGRLHDELAARAAADWFRSHRWDAEIVASGTHLWDVEEACVSVVNLATVRAVERAAGRPIEPERFRANLYVDGMAPWSEFGLVGGRARVGGAELEFFHAIDRCRATSVRPGSGEVDVNLPAFLSGQFGFNYCGLFARVTSPGDVTAGDAVTPDPRTVAPAGDETAPRWATVVSTDHPCDDVLSVTLADPWGALASARAGQHLRLHRTDDAGWRDYTLSRIGERDARISVRRVAAGRFSPWVHRLRAGDRVLISGPFGDATLDDGPEPLLLLTAGIGITPALAMLDALARRSSTRRVDLVHVVRGDADLVHWPEVTASVSALPGARTHLFVTGGASERRPSPAFIRSLVPSHARISAHVCGGSEFTAAMRSTLLTSGVDAGDIHLDPFYSPRPTTIVPRRPTSPGPHEVTFGAGRTVVWHGGDGTLLELAEAAGLRPAWACRAGVCGTCAAPVSGATEYLVDPLCRLEDGEVLLCCAVPSANLCISHVT